MSNIKDWLKIITNNDLHAYNKVNTRDLAICFNFLQLPDTETVVMTITIMKNKVKKNSLDPKSFARVMSSIESGLEDAYSSQVNQGKELEYEYYQNVKSELSTQWYVQLCCHRVFFIPENGLWTVIENLFNQNSIRTMKENDIEEVAVYANTENFDFNGKFY